MEDLLEPDPEARLGCRTSAFEEFQNHGFFSDFNFVALEERLLISCRTSEIYNFFIEELACSRNIIVCQDGSLTSPFNDRCQTEVTHFYKTTLSKLSFDAPCVHFSCRGVPVVDVVRT